MMIVIGFLAAGMPFVSYCQYYYNDILTISQTNNQYRLLKNNHIQQMSARSYEANGELTNDFMLRQTISRNSTVITTTAEYPSTGMSISTSYYENDKIVNSSDSVENLKSTTAYSYSDNKLISINTTTEDKFTNTSSEEMHQWFYENEMPVKMLLIKDNNDTITVNFTKDEDGNIAEERWIKKGKRIQNYFYYYNSRHQLTDIVRYNAKAQRLLPDYLFEYDNNGVLIKLTQVPQASDNYIVWQYIYLPNGLKEKELLFNKQKQPIGKVEYSYQ